MNKKQLIVAWITVLFLTVLVGMETRVLFGDPIKFHLNGLFLYGIEVIRYDTQIFGRIVNIGFINSL